MKLKYFFCFFIGLFFCSCASIKLPDGTEYRRFGNQELNDISIEVSRPDGTQVKATLDSQKSEREIAEVLMSLSENLDKALQILLELEQKIPSLVP